MIGPAVVGGRCGEQASLNNLDNRGNLIHTVDYRNVYASILDGWMGSDSEALLSSRFESLPLFA